MLAAAGADATLAFIELGAVVFGLAVMARAAQWLGITPIPFYLVAGLLVGEGGLVHLDVSTDFVSIAAEIGVLLLLLTLGLEYTGDELRAGLRTGARPGLIDWLVNFTPGVGLGFLLGWNPGAAFLLGGVTWVSSSGVAAKVLTDLDRLPNRETPAVLNVLVIEDLAMAAYLPAAAAVVAGSKFGDTAVTVAIAFAAVALILTMSLRWGHQLSRMLASGSDEALLLGVFGLTLLVGGLAQRVQVSAAIGAFLVGLALSGPVQERAGALVEPLRDLFAATFFLFFSYQIRPSALTGVIVPAVALLVVCTAGKFVSGWVAAAPLGVSRNGRLRAGAALVARGEFSIVIATLGATTADGAELTALAAAFVLLTATVGPLLTRMVGTTQHRSTSRFFQSQPG